LQTGLELQYREKKQPSPNVQGQQRAYIVGTGMITSIGANAAMTAASVRAGISRYTISDYLTNEGQPITMCSMPEEVFSSMQVDVDEWDYYSGQYDHIIKMAIIALQEAVSGLRFERPIPLVLAMPEPGADISPIFPKMLITSLVKQSELPLSVERVRTIHTGRAAGIQGLDLALRYLYELGEDYVLLGGSDSHACYPRLEELDARERLLTSTSLDGFAPGEGAGFLLLTRHPARGLTRDGHIVALCSPGESEEPGHIYSDEPYRGDGLDQAFKLALQNHQGPAIRTVYSSMNGERYWAKEYGVAMMRSKSCFQEEVTVEHPADCYGDLGAATGPVLIGLAADNLLKQPGLATHLVYSSSDCASRAALRVEKIPRT